MPSSNSKSTQATLQALLKSSAPDKIQSCLLKGLENASTAEQEVLSAILAPLITDASVSLHCVRCHSTYTENKNHSRACKIKHNEEGDSERTEIGDDAMTTTLACCGASFDSEDGPDTKYCYMTHHTTNTDDVVYYDEVDDDDDGDGVNHNVVSCASRGCSKKRKAVKKGGAKNGPTDKKQRS